MFAARRARRTRADLALVTDVIAALSAARLDTTAPIPVEQLPVAVGLANLHADVLAAMPMTTGRRTPAVIAQPNPEESRHTTVHKLIQSAWWTGNAYLYGNADAVTVLDPNTVSYDIDPGDPNRVANWYVGSNPIDRRMLHVFKINDDPRKGPIGRSPLAASSEPLRMYGYAYAYLANFFAAGGNPSTVLQRKGPASAIYDPEQAASDWISARQARRPAVLPDGWELSVPPNNGELEAISRILEKCAAEVARLVNAPPSLVNAEANGSMTYSTVAGEISRWLSLSLVPTWITRLEDFWSTIAGVPVTIDTDVMFRLVSPVDAPTAAPRLEAIAS